MKKKTKYILYIILGGITLMTVALLNGCGLGGESIPQNRTKKQYEFEKTFEPMFKFLEQEKKEFTGLEAYQSSVNIKIGDDVKNYEVDLDTTQSDIRGDYTITSGDNEETVPVTYSSGKLNYSSEISPLFDEEILNLVVQRDYFASLDVKETFDSAETELREIIYQPENHSELYKTLKNKYNLPEDTYCRVRVKYSSGSIYRISVQMKSKDKSIQIDLRIFRQ